MKRTRLTVLWLCILLGVVGGALAQNGSNPSNDTSVVQNPYYVIQPNDVLEIFVWKEPELSRKVVVRPDGRISVPLVQDLVAGGMTPAELRNEIENQLGEFITSPSVTVIVEAILHYKVYVTGKVQEPGVYGSTEPINVLQALSMAGGFQDYAEKDQIAVVRRIGREYVTTSFNYGQVTKGKNPQQNILLRSGDVVVVP